jgi:hypothetical protein
MVFNSEKSLKKAKVRYYTLVGFSALLAMKVHHYIRSDAPQPDWLFPEGMFAVLLFPVAILPFFYFIMPEKEFYDPSKHEELL